ncbi:OmpW family outer membrane protein [Limnohabitans sp. INBF002]|uniref:OmpW/AlkL family protein n=1 Tax=Limnohabitans sp. INBF002 TaxID=2986280 RepID=UPI0023770C71|nr:OmpW family outer membrane protein [Limnohabitans sp. INBF002]BDU52106.1 putative outer-membrane protein y4mB [Limnohabitans sp. INBF002]
MKKILIAAAVGMLVAGQVAAQESPWLVRARAVKLSMANHDATGLDLSVNDKTIPELDVSYFFNKNVAAELVLTIPQQQTVSIAGADSGTFKHLPPTLTVQYHFTNFNGFKPYVGAGLNYTKISKTNVLNGAATLENSSFGYALQAGVDVPLTKQVSLNFDVKKVNIQSEVYVNNVSKGTLKLDPVLVGVGIGYRF